MSDRTMLDKIFDSVESSNGDTNTTWAAALSLATDNGGFIAADDRRQFPAERE